MSAAAWVQSLEIPAQPTEPDIKAFFNIPPDGEEKLDSNIAKKKRAWRSKAREQVVSEAAERKIKQALALITELEKRVKRGIVDTELDLEALREEFRSTTPDRVDSLEELWRILEELLAAGKMAQALATAHDALERWSDEAAAAAAFAWLASIASRSDETTSDALRRQGLDAAERALERGMRNADTFTWRSVLQLDLADYEGALATIATAEAELGSLTPWLHSHRCEGHAAAGDVERAAREAIAAVNGAPQDSTLRMNTTAALVKAIRWFCLPVSTKEQMDRYADVVQTAAWCAHGDPVAEDHVRVFRLWSVQAQARHYVGRWDIRSLAAVASGFLLLPLLNRARSKPVWQVFFEGPEKHGDDWQIVARSGAVRAVHEGFGTRLPWNAGGLI